MITFEITKHIEMDEENQGINLTEFSVTTDDQSGSDEMVEVFIRSSSFAYDSLRDCIKQEPAKGYLRRAFHFDRVSLADFRKTDKEGAWQFLIDFSNEPDWSIDRPVFIKQLARYRTVHNQMSDGDFYILSKDWFDADDERLAEPERSCYIYYFLIISVDRGSGALILLEWTYD